MRALGLIASLVGCSGRVTESAPTDAGLDAPEVAVLGACGAEGDVGICEGRPSYFPVDWARRCVDYAAKGFDTCVCKRTSLDCLVEPDSGVLFVAPCSGPRPAGCCDCAESTRLEATALPICP